MEEADAMVANANKVLDLANAHKSEALATQMETIAEEFKTAAEVRPQRFSACGCHVLALVCSCCLELVAHMLQLHDCV